MTAQSGPFDWNNMHEEQKLERIRQEQLNEIMQNSELG